MELNRTNITEQSQAFYLEHRDFRIAKIAFYSTIFILSCVGNSLVAIIIVGAKDMRTPSNFLILNLALCDFLTPAVGIPFDFALEESKYIWPFGSVLCKVLWPFETACSTSSSLTLAMISFERLRTLSKPFAGRISMSHVLLFILAIHTLSICLCIPYYFALNFNDVKSSCNERWPSVGSKQAYTVVLCLSGYVLPLTTMSVAYVLIYRSLRSNLLRLISKDSSHKRPRNVSKTSESSTLSRNSMEHKRKEQNIRLAKMFIIVVVVFAVSMFPNQVLWLWADFGNGKNNKFFHYISVVSRLCTYANSVLNPFIYALKSKEFRSGFARIGRASMQPLRKISHGTRKFARKISRASDNHHTVSTQSAQVMLPAKDNQTDDDLNRAVIHEVQVSKRAKDQNTTPIIFDDMSIDISILDTLLYLNLLEELRETDC